MGLWQMIDAKGVAQAEQFEDGLAFMPGEDGFSTDPVDAEAARLGEGFTYSMIGVPGWHARIEAEQAAAAAAEDAKAGAALEAERAAAARARIAQLVDPDGYAYAQAKAAAHAELALLLEHAEPSEREALKAALGVEG
jgi:hypothetical protein